MSGHKETGAPIPAAELLAQLDAAGATVRLFCSGACGYIAADAANLVRHFAEEHTDPNSSRSHG